MPKTSKLLEQIKGQKAKALFNTLYGKHEGVIAFQTDRYTKAVHSYHTYFGQESNDVSIFSTSGRTEVGGNHTDHNGGRVLAAGVSLDTLAVIAPVNDGIITIYSEGFPDVFVVNVAEIEIQEKEKGTTLALIRGIVARMQKLGLQIGGFQGYVASSVLRGSGLSSSAAFEVLICTILDHLYNDGKLDGKQVAMISQYAENVYFGKPCGLMDQTACALGGFVTIDFEDFENPKVRSVAFDFAASGYRLVVVDTGGDHTNLTEEYASITDEMKQIAAYYGKSVLRQVPVTMIEQDMGVLRCKVSDRAVLRALHFHDDDRRVVQEVEALDQADFQKFLSLVIQSGESSWKLLQNCYVGGYRHQGLTLALAASERILKGKGAWRVHGGGFAGTIQAFVPDSMVDEYTYRLNHIFGKNACTLLSIRPIGSIRVSFE